MHRRLLKRFSGATLIELVVTIAVVSIAVVVLMELTSRSTARSVDPMIQEQAVAIAHAYLAEVMNKGFCDPDALATAGQSCPVYCTGPVCGTCSPGSPNEPSRPLYDDICDYNGLSNVGAVDQNGTPIPGLGRYDVSVQVSDDSSVNLNGLSGSAGQVARITVTVTHPDMQSPVKVTGFRTNY